MTFAERFKMYTRFRWLRNLPPDTCINQEDVLERLEAELTPFIAQLQRQQVHVDEIKRLCHVRS